MGRGETIDNKLGNRHMFVEVVKECNKSLHFFILAHDFLR